tara:strand:+ start:8798 stop:9313 length:516 start_codon:yes stop_codon:yes gene_type:complete
MNTRKHTHNAGFTLVEILIVVVILGILSAIVIPQFTSASDTAKANALTTQLQTIRSQLELYRVQHNDDYPNLAGNDGWDLLTEKTDADGTLNASGSFGPYLQKAPTNSFDSSSTITALTVGADPSTTGTAGWAYDSTTGEIRGILSTASATKVGMTEDDGDIVLVTEEDDD